MTGHTRTIADLVAESARQRPDAEALVAGQRRFTFAGLDDAVARAAAGLLSGMDPPGARIAIWLDHGAEALVAIFAAVRAGFVAVPVNPKLKPAQAAHIVADCNAALLVTSATRRAQVAPFLASSCRTIATDPGEDDVVAALGLAGGGAGTGHRRIDTDPAMLFYTSGSTGLPKGVTVSHRNLLEGARSVNAYLHTAPGDRVAGLLPLTFDAGFSQATTAFAAGACLVLCGFLRPEDAVRVLDHERVTMITGVPPLWHQLADVAWPEAARRRLRLFANTGGHMPGALLARLRDIFTDAAPVLMYGLTEAFRSTHLDPAEVDARPGSIGRAIPGNEVLVLRPDGSPCEPGEPGELVHRGPLVALGYWGDPAMTARRFRPLPSRGGAGLLPEIAVFSGDVVTRDADGFLYFRGRADDQIKTSGYRVSPQEIEIVLADAPGVAQGAVFGVADERLGQRIVAAISTVGPPDLSAIRRHCQQRLASYMLPDLWPLPTMPLSPNGKIDRVCLRERYQAGAIEPSEAAE